MKLSYFQFDKEILGSAWVYSSYRKNAARQGGSVIKERNIFVYFILTSGVIFPLFIFFQFFFCFGCFAPMLSSFVFSSYGRILTALGIVRTIAR